MTLKMQVNMSVGRVGWSESVYLETSGTPESAFPEAMGYVQLRRPLSDPAINFDSVRVSDANDARKVAILQIDSSGPFDVPNVIDRLFDMPFTSIMIRWTMANGQKGRTYLRGLADGVTAAAESIIVNPAWLNKFEAFQLYVSGNGFVPPLIPYLGLTKSPTTNLTIPITNIEVNTVEKRIELILDPTGIDFTKKIRVSKVQSNPLINGLWSVKSVDSDRIALVGPPFTGTLSFLPGGFVLTQFQEFSRIVLGQQVRFASRRIGRPFGSRPSGRRKKQKALVFAPTV